MSKEEKPYKKEKIPIAVRTAIWNKFIGVDKGIGYCYVGCGNVIQIATMQAGHIKAEAMGGETTIENLRPICSHCNTSMGKTDMREFIVKYKFDSPLLKESSYKAYKPKKDDNLVDVSEPINKLDMSTNDYSDQWKSFGWDECIFAVNRINDINRLKLNINEYNSAKKCKIFLSKYDRMQQFLKPYLNMYTKQQLVNVREFKPIINKTKSKQNIIDDIIKEYETKQIYNVVIIPPKHDSSKRWCIIS